MKICTNTRGIKIDGTSQVPVAHAYNPSYLGGRYWEDHGSKSTPGEIVCATLISKKLITKMFWWSGSR
jgi:hypothetical protein